MNKHTFSFKKMFRLLTLLLMITMLAGCTASTKSNQTEDLDNTEVDGVDAEALANEGKDDEAYTHAKVNVRYPETVNWDSEKSIVQTAIDNKTMIIQFFAGEGCYIGGNGADTAKWGDAVLLVFPNGETMLIDGGMKDYGPFLADNLKKLGVEKLDYCMMSHQHEDHYQGFFTSGGVFDNFEVGTFYWSGVYSAAYGARTKLRVEKLVESYGAELVAVAQGDEFTFGDVKMTILAPEIGRIGGTSYSDSDEDVNADSVVARFDYGEISYLTAGDYYMTAERALMERVDAKLLEVDIAKMNHHGRTTSSSDDWCEALNAKIAVATGSIEVANSTYKSYAKVGTTPYIDTYEGYVRVEAKNDGSFTVVTSRERQHEMFDAMDEMYGIERTGQY